MMWTEFVSGLLRRLFREKKGEARVKEAQMGMILYLGKRGGGVVWHIYIKR